jgi:predicted carbohydrate-binding protein with CBM48
VTEREDSLDGIIEILREPAGLAPDLTQRVMAEVGRLPPHGAAAGPIRWWRRHWTIRLSPVRGLGLAAGLAVLLLAVYFAGRQGAPAVQPTAEPAGGRLTQFVLIAPEASTVTLVGDFNDWSMAATPLVRAEGGGVWSVTVPLVPGRYRYAFVVNGTVWQNDPEAAAAEDEFGRSNSVLTVGGGT